MYKKLVDLCKKYVEIKSLGRNDFILNRLVLCHDPSLYFMSKARERQGDSN